MKHVIFRLTLYVVLFSCLSVTVIGQSIGRVAYQSVVRDDAGELVKSTQVGLRISVLQGSASGTTVFQETHTPTTNANGLLSIVIGEGSNQTGSLDAVDFGAGVFFFKLEIDPSGGSNYTSSLSTEILSVPYALYASQSDGIDLQVSEQGDTLYFGSGGSIVIPGLSAVNSAGGSYPPGYQFCDGVVTEIVDVLNPVTNATWMDRNLGARQVADSSMDVRAYGDLFQWGRFADGHQCRFPLSRTTEFNATTAVSTPQATDWYGKFIPESSPPIDWLVTPDTNLWKGADGVNNPCPTSYRLPTIAELEAERLSWVVDPINSTNTSAGAMASPLRLPAAGYRKFSSGAVEDVGSYGDYWSSSVSGSNARYLGFDSGDAYVDSDFRNYGSSVRCLKD